MVLIIDLHNLAHRAAHAYEKLWSGDVFTGLYHGVFSMLESYVKKLRPTSIVVVSDEIVDPTQGGYRAPTWRKSLYDNYKDRERVRDEKSEKRYRATQTQLVELKRVLQWLPIHYVESRACEADDIIGWLCTQTLRGVPKTIVSTDKDMFQLVDHTTSIFYPSSTNQRTITFMTFAQHARDIGKNSVINTPADWLEFRALMGDASDNIGGVKRCGAVTAAKILAEGGFEQWRANRAGRSDLGKIEQSFMSAEALEDYKLSKLLMRLPPNVMESGFVGVQVPNSNHANPTAFAGWCQQLGLNKIAQGIFGLPTAGGNPWER